MVIDVMLIRELASVGSIWECLATLIGSAGSR